MVIFGSLKFLSPAWNHARLLYYQHRCFTRVEPSSAIVFDESSSTLKTDADWERFYAIFSPPGGKHDATVFIRELRRPDGSTRLVVVEASPGLSSMPDHLVTLLFAPPIRFDSTVISPGGILQQPQLCSNTSWLTPFGFVNMTKFRLYAGQVDPTNPSHFTIAFDYPDHSGTIDGWLQPNDSILFELRDPLPRAAK